MRYKFQIKDANVHGRRRLRVYVRQVDRSKGFAVDAAYYRANRSDIAPLRVHDRDCQGCKNNMLRCDITSANISIIIELLVLEYTVDNEVSTNAIPFQRMTQWSCYCNSSQVNVAGKFSTLSAYCAQNCLCNGQASAGLRPSVHPIIRLQRVCCWALYEQGNRAHRSNGADAANMDSVM